MAYLGVEKLRALNADLPYGARERIAQELGLSRQTIYKVLKGYPAALETQRKVVEAARREIERARRRQQEVEAALDFYNE
jgi:predicted transcriptional regulator